MEQTIWRHEKPPITGSIWVLHLLPSLDGAPNGPQLLQSSTDLRMHSQNRQQKPLLPELPCSLSRFFRLIRFDLLNSMWGSFTKSSPMSRHLFYLFC